MTDHSALVQRGIVRSGGQHFIPGSQTAHNVKPEVWQAIELEHGRIGFLNEPCFLFQLAFKLTRSPAGVAYKRTNCNQVLLPGCLARLFKSDVMIEFESFALLPFKRREHQLIFADRPAEKHRHLGEACRWCLTHQIGHLLVERAIDDYAQGTLVWVM